MIVDAHCHAGPGDGFQGPWDTRADLTQYLRRAAEAGIQRTVLIPAFHSDYRVANAWVATQVRRGGGRFAGVAAIHPVRDQGRVERLVGAAMAAGLQGLKVHHHDGWITREVMNAASARRLPVIYDVQGSVDHVELVAEEYPTVPIVLPHLGSFGDDWKAQKRCIDLAARLPSVFADSSGSRRVDLMEEFIERAGPHKLIFGSDGPWLHPGVELEKIRLLNLRGADERLVMGETVLRLLHEVTNQHARRVDHRSFLGKSVT